MPQALNAPGVGPIVGHTTQTQSRIFIRAATQDVKDFGRCVGVARCRRAGAGAWGAPVLNKLSPNFDLTGVFVFDGLQPGTEHEYQAGWFIAGVDFDDLDPNLEFVWDTLGSSTFRTVPAAAGVRAYVVGSCRYLLRLFGGNWFDDRGDKVFRSVLRQMDGNPAMPLDALVMIGDQIYADDLKFIKPDRRLDEFLERYRIAFSQEHLRRLMSRVPTYMILDDHEIEDNWPSNATQADHLTLYPHAIHAYQIYQASHGPLFRAVAGGRIEGTLTHFWYTFGDAVADWFVMDTRTERDPSMGRMIGALQMQALLDWLTDGSGRIKFIVSSVPMFPDMASDKADKWSAFPGQRKEILDVIFSQRIPHVVVLSGDVHTSFSCTLRVKNEPGFGVHGVVSSSFFWPYPHMSRGSFLFDQPLANMGMRTLISELRSDDCFGDDNYTRLEVLPDLRVRVSVYQRKGDPLQADLVL